MDQIPIFCEMPTSSAVPGITNPEKLCFTIFQVARGVKTPPANAGDVRDTGWIPGSGRSPEGGPGNPCQYSCLKNSKDREAWWATVHRVAQSQTPLKRFSMHAPSPENNLADFFQYEGKSAARKLGVGRLVWSGGGPRI